MNSVTPFDIKYNYRESFTTFNYVDMSILKKEPLYNHLNLDSLAKRGQVKIKINENEDI